MRRNAYAILAVLCMSASAAADFTDDFQNALRLYNEGKHTEACTRFTAIAEKAPKPGAKSDALRYAVLSAIKAKQFGAAEQLLTQIPRESTKHLCRMNLLLAQGRPQELVNRFQHEDLSNCSHPGEQ